MARKKSQDPALTALMDEQKKAVEEFERWYARCKRAFTRMDKIKKKLIPLSRRIDDRLAQADGP